MADGKIDEDRYSRQIGAYGMEAMKAFSAMKVLVVGASGVGAETAKDLVLSGPSAVFLWDPVPVKEIDLGVNCFLRLEHVEKQSRAEASVPELKQLNPYVNVSSVTADLHLKPGEGETSLKAFKQLVEDKDITVVVVTQDTPLDVLEQWGDFCHESGIAFLVGLSRGVSGFFFADFSTKGGKPHIVKDPDGVPLQSMSIANVTVSEGEKGCPDVVVEVATYGDVPHGLDDDDWLRIENVEGMPYINREFQVRRVYNKYRRAGQEQMSQRLDPARVKLVLPSGVTYEELGKYEANGFATKFHQPTEVSFSPFRDSWKKPLKEGKLCIPVMHQERMFENRGGVLHNAQIAIWRFWEREGRPPALHSKEDAEKCVQIAKEIKGPETDAPMIGKEGFDDDWAEAVRKIALYYSAELPGLGSFMGGVLAQEVVKRSGKYTPLQQWLHFDYAELLNAELPTKLEGMTGRYGHQISVFGADFQKKLAEQNAFLVGCGALGCEYIKSFALMGLATGGGKLHITDLDRIEVSNLSRQFLFRQENVHQQKSKCAAERAKVMNPACDIVCHDTAVGTKTEDYFNFPFWESLDIVCNALDNTKARLYTDGKCVLHMKPLLESGTEGTMASSDIIVPKLTKTYGDDFKEEASPTENIPMCTLKNFPYLLEHCIEWARSQFTDTFEAGFKEYIAFREDREKFMKDCEEDKAMKRESQCVKKCRRVWRLVQISRKPTFEDAIELAVAYYTKHFLNGISKLILKHPEDMMDKNPDTGVETPFWAAPKRFPRAAEFGEYGEAQEGCLDFLFATANIFANSLGLDYVTDKAVFEEKLKESRKKPEEFMADGFEFTREGSVAFDDPVSGLDVTGELEPASTMEEKAKESTAEELSRLLGDLKAADLATLKAFSPQDFEKDDDSNHHIDFIVGATNMRAYNYRIDQGTRHKIKMTAGRIIPALASTTAMITGLVSLELYKLVLNVPLEKLVSSQVNLALDPGLSATGGLPQACKPSHIPAEFRDEDLDVDCEACPPSFTKWDRVLVEGELTTKQFLEAFKVAFKQQYPEAPEVWIREIYAGGEAVEVIWSEDDADTNARLEGDTPMWKYYDETSNDKPIPDDAPFIQLDTVYFKWNREREPRLPKLLWYNPKGKLQASVKRDRAAPGNAEVLFESQGMKLLEFDGKDFSRLGIVTIKIMGSGEISATSEEGKTLFQMSVRGNRGLKEHREGRAFVWSGGDVERTLCVKIPKSVDVLRFCGAFEQAGAGATVYQDKAAYTS